MLGPIGTPELIIIGVVIILLFGVGKISGLGRELGSSIKEFRRAVKEPDEKKEPEMQQVHTAAPQPPAQPQYAPPPQPAPPPQQQVAQPTSGDKNIF
jgi:sec-independent protein translocase protein TatA